MYSGIADAVSHNPEWSFRNRSKEELWFDMDIEAAPTTSPVRDRDLPSYRPRITPPGCFRVMAFLLWSCSAASCRASAR